MPRNLKLLFLVILSAVVAYISLGFSYRSFVTPKSNQGELYKIHGDSWLEDGAEIRFSKLAPRGNRAVLTFEPWRPDSVGPANLSISVCGVPYGDRIVTSDPIVVHLSGNCEPRTIQFAVNNPFVASDADQRVLGAQLKSVEVQSKLGLPIASVRHLLFATAFLIGITVLAFTLFGSVALSSLLVVGAGVVLGSSESLRLFSPYLLLACLGLIGIGALIAKRVDYGELDDEWWPVALATLAIVLGAALRGYGINFGLPMNFHPDEVPKVNAMMRMVAQGNLDPNYFLHPSFLLYATYGMNTFLHWFGIAGTFQETGFLAGRLVSTTAGILSIYLVYQIGRRTLSAQAGALGAAMLAVFPLHVTCSRYLKEDSLLTFFALLTVLVVVWAVSEGKKSLLLLAGVIAGCATSTKYTGFLMIAAVGFAPWLSSQNWKPDPKWIIPTFLAILCMPIGFLLLSPYAYLNSTKFIHDFNHERGHMMKGHTILIDAWSQYWMYHIGRSIIPGVSYLATALGLLGFGLLAWRRKMMGIYVILLFLLFYLPAEFVKAKPAPQPERYILPCLPFLALGAAEFLRMLWSTRLKMALPLVALVAIGMPATRSIQLAGEIKNDTRTELRDWMIENIPKGSKVLIDWKPYSPRFDNGEFESIYLSRSRIIPSLLPSSLKSMDADYLLMSSLYYGRYFNQPNVNPAQREVIRNVFRKIPIVTEFTPKHGTYGFHNPTVTLLSLREEDFAKFNEERELRLAGKIEKTSNEQRASYRWTVGG